MSEERESKALDLLHSCRCSSKTVVGKKEFETEVKIDWTKIAQHAKSLDMTEDALRDLWSKANLRHFVVVCEEKCAAFDACSPLQAVDTVVKKWDAVSPKTQCGARITAFCREEMRAFVYVRKEKNEKNEEEGYTLVSKRKLAFPDCLSVLSSETLQNILSYK